MTKSVEGAAVGAEGLFGMKMSPGPRSRPVGAARRASHKKSISTAAGVGESVDGEERSGTWLGGNREERRDAEYGKPNPESGPFIKSGGFFGKLCGIFHFVFLCFGRMEVKMRRSFESVSEFERRFLRGMRKKRVLPIYTSLSAMRLDTFSSVI